MAKKAAIYLRSSKDRHDVSVESQRRELSNFIQEQGDVLVAEFTDKVESAKTDDRPGFQAMIAEAKQKERRFQRIYYYDTSRFSRRQYHAQMYKHLLRKQGIDLIFLKLPKTDSMLHPVVESLMEIFDEFHSQKSKMDGLRGMRENIKQGWRAGGRAILGYRLTNQVVGLRDGQPITKSKLEPDPKHFPTVQAVLCQEFLTPETVAALKAEIDRELASKSKDTDHFLVQLKDELRQIERQISELVDLVTQVNHKRPLLERLEKLEEERQGVESKLREQEALPEPAPVLNLSDASVKQFLSTLQRGLQEGDAEKKKALLRNVVEYGVFDGEQLTLHPAFARLTGVKLASPRGFEPRLPP